MRDGCHCRADLEELIQQLRKKGVSLWLESAGLRFRAPKGTITVEERQALSNANVEIASLLERDARVANMDAAGGQDTGVRRAPLSFTQLEQWHDRLRCGGRPIRHIAAELHLQGPIRVDLLKQSVAIISMRHDALRTRIVREGSLLLQEVANGYCSELEVIQLWSVPEARRNAEMELQIKRVILDADNYAESPLFKAVLLAMAADKHILIVALDHMISDLASLYLLVAEVITVYTALSNNITVALPHVRVQFPELAARIRSYSTESLAKAETRLASIGRTRFPEDLPVNALEGKAGIACTPFVINRNLAEELHAWARRHGTTIVIATLTAYAALVLRWCGVTETVILFMTDGRTSAQLEHTVGYLAFAVYVRVSLAERSTFLDLLGTVTEEYCRARDDADYGCAMAREVRPAFTRNTAVNWLRTGGSRSSTIMPGTEVALRRSPLDFSESLLRQVVECDQEPGVSFCEENGTIVGQVGYACNRFSPERMTEFAGNIVEFLTQMLRTPNRQVMDVKLM